MVILVTGGAGFLGHHLVQLLLRQGHQVVVMDSLWTGSKEKILNLDWNQNFRYVIGDVRDTLPDIGKVEQIYHLACPASPDRFEEDPIGILETCFRGTQNILDLAVKCKARVLLASTSETYGDPEVSPQPETYRGNVNCFGPRSCYDEGKRVAEALAFAYRAKHKLEIRVARIFNAYGPHMELRDGRAVPNFIAAAIENTPIVIYGDGSATRCFQFATDCVRGLEALMNSDYDRPVNIGSDDEMQVGEVATMVAKIVAGKLARHDTVPVTFHEKREDDPVQRKPDISLAKQVLGWQPTISLQEGIEATVDWFIKRSQRAVDNKQQTPGASVSAEHFNAPLLHCGLGLNGAQPVRKDATV